MKIFEVFRPAKQKIVVPTSKPRDPNWEALEAKRRSGAMGQHKNKKRELELGNKKHKFKDEY